MAISRTLEADVFAAVPKVKKLYVMVPPCVVKHYVCDSNTYIHVCVCVCVCVCVSFSSNRYLSKNKLSGIKKAMLDMIEDLEEFEMDAPGQYFMFETEAYNLLDKHVHLKRM